jgi:hypothetical protein
MAIEDGTPLPLISHFVPDNHHSHSNLPVLSAPFSRPATGILPRGGTILGTSRFNPLKDEQCLPRLKENWECHQLSGLIVVGGEGSLSAARDLWRDHQINIVGIPKTIDNDVCGTDFTFGFDTAVSIVTDAIDRLHSTAESHHRVMVVEVMGRHTGWIAAYGGIAGGADVVLVPEHPVRLSRVTGGGARSAWWMQLKADLLGMPVEVTDQSEPGTLGAALLAGVGIGTYGSLAEAASRVRIARRFEPDPARAERYASKVERHRATVASLLETGGSG